MRRTILLLSFTLLIFNIAKAQKTTDGVKSNIQRLKLFNLNTDIKRTALRIWINTKQVVEITSDSTGKNCLRVLSYIYEYDNVEIHKKIQHWEIEVLDDSMLTKVQSLIQHNIQVLRNNYREGQGGFDGYSYEVELSLNGIYSDVNWWFSDLQSKKIDQIKMIDDLIAMLKLNDIYRRFQKSLPPGKYTEGDTIFGVLPNG